MSQTVQASLTVREFQAKDRDAFRLLNEDWIEEHFKLEEKDRQTLNDPQLHILDKGGYILLGERHGEVIACCALLAMPDGEFEVAKMAVAKTHRGHGVGRQMLESTIAFAHAKGMRRLYLETNAKLKNAIHLYEAVGFRHLPAERIKPSPYARANVYMEMDLA